MQVIREFPYGKVDNCHYLPIAAFNRQVSYLEDLNLLNYIRDWNRFSHFADNQNQIDYLNSIDKLTRTEIAKAIHASHPNKGQISIDKLTKKIELLSPGAYNLYHHLYRVDRKRRAKSLSDFLKKSWNGKNIHGRSWVIYEAGYASKLIAPFIEQGYVSVYSFYIQD